MHPDLAERYHAHNEALLEEQAEHEAAEVARMGATRHPSLIIALTDAFNTASENGCDAVMDLLIEQWIAGNPLAHAAVPESDICDALRPYWEAISRDEY